MPWNPTEIDSEILAVHAALMPTGAQGEVVLFGGDEHWSDQQESAGNGSWKKTRIYDVATRTIVPGQVQSPESDVFCAHHVFTGDGRLLIAGGTSEWPVGGDGHAHDLDFLGHSRCWLYSPRQRKWTETTRLNRNRDQPDVPRSGGRWYPGLVALGDGSAIAFFGHLDEDDFRHRNIRPERYLPGRRAWVDLPADIGNFGEPNQGGRRFLFFMRGQVLPSGKIFSTTPMPVNFAGTADGSDGPHFSTAFDPDAGLYTMPRAASPDGVDDAWSFPSVLLPLLRGGDHYNARFLYWDGSAPRWIDTDAASPSWQPTGPRNPATAALARTYGQAVILPTGQICAIGGVSTVGSATVSEVPVGQVELYTPDIDWSTNSYGSGGGTWSLEPGSAINARNYHSTALLLPNGQVWVAGGDHEAKSGNPDVVGVKKIELYEPPYIAVPNRIAIQSAPSLLGYGQEFEVQIDRAAAQIGRAALIRNGSVTHATDNDQRYVGLEIVSTSGNSVRFRAPPSGNVAPPGYYMLWVMDGSGVPCQLARFVRVGHLSCRVIADRSTFSEEEVQALGGGGNANFSAALYVDFDGFLASELSGTPGWALEWVAGGAVGMSEMRLQFAGRFDEASPPDPDVPTRVTFAFDVIFPSMDAFSGWPDTRDLTVRFTLGAHSCSTTIGLTKSPNPYMIDVDPVAHNANWLSTDVRVFKMRPNQMRFGATLSMSGTGPFDYIRTVTDRLRAGTENFEAIAASGPDTTLDGAYLSGTPPQPTFNFAVARVRYRATSTVAQDVRCFFRICNAAATGLEFDTNTVYRKTAGANPVPLLGVQGGQIVSIPFVNAPRVASVTGQAGATSTENQTLDATYDIQDITPVASGAEVTVFFGVYLDINTPTKRFPVAPAGNGPYPDATSLPIRDLLRSWHNCLVAEIVFPADPTRVGATPGDSDNLAQRNLAIIGLENPGLSASRTAMHSFELRPSPIGKGHPLTNPTRPDHVGASALAVAQRQVWPDELFFDWHNLPAETQVTLYFSDLDTADIEAMLVSRVSPPAFTVLDATTLKFKVGECAWMPLPGGREVRIPALISIALPDGIVEGQTYRASIRQVDGRSGRIIGSFTIEMPVSKAPFLLPEAQRQLSFLGHVATTLAPGDRWLPLFERLLQHLAARVDALGGRSDRIEPNPDGSGKPYRPIPWKPGDPFPSSGFGSGEAGDCPDQGERCLQWPRWFIAAASALILIFLGTAISPATMTIAALAVVAIALAGAAWARACKGRIACGLAESVLLGSASGTAILAVAASLGTPVQLLAIAVGGTIVAVSVITMFLLRCRDRCCG